MSVDLGVVYDDTSRLPIKVPDDIRSPETQIVPPALADGQATNHCGEFVTAWTENGERAADRFVTVGNKFEGLPAGWPVDPPEGLKAPRPQPRHYPRRFRYDLRTHEYQMRAVQKCTRNLHPARQTVVRAQKMDVTPRQDEFKRGVRGFSRRSA